MSSDVNDKADVANVDQSYTRKAKDIVSMNLSHMLTPKLKLTP